MSCSMVIVSTVTWHFITKYQYKTHKLSDSPLISFDMTGRALVDVQKVNKYAPLMQLDAFNYLCYIYVLFSKGDNARTKHSFQPRPISSVSHLSVTGTIKQRSLRLLCWGTLPPSVLTKRATRYVPLVALSKPAGRSGNAGWAQRMAVNFRPFSWIVD